MESARRAESEGGFELAFALYANLEPESIRELGFIGMTEMYPSLLSDYLRERGDAPLEMLDLIKKELAEGVEYHIAAKSYSMLSHGNHTGVEAAVSVAAVDALELILEIRGSAWRLGMSNILMDPIVIKSILNSGIALGEFIQPSALQRCRSNPVDRMYTDKEITQVPGIFNRHYLMNRKREAWGNPLSFADIRARTEHTGRSQE